MTEIPVIAVTSDQDNELVSGSMRFDGLTPYIECETDYNEKVRSVVSGFSERRPILLIDVKGLQKRNINPVLLKRLKIHGADTWYLTNIESVDDVFDSFNTDAKRVLMPCHTVKSEDEIEDILKVSDSVIPAIFVRNGTTLFMRKKMEPSVLSDDLFDRGFTTVAVFDIDGSVSDDTWSRMRSQGRIVPCSHTGKAVDGFDPVFKEIL